MAVGSAHSSIDNTSMEIHGRNLFDGLHKKKLLLALQKFVELLEKRLIKSLLQSSRH